MAEKFPVTVKGISGELLAALSDAGSMTVREVERHVASLVPPPGGVAYRLVHGSEMLPPKSVLHDVVDADEVTAVRVSIIAGDYLYRRVKKAKLGQIETITQLSLSDDMTARCKAFHGNKFAVALEMEAHGTWESSASVAIITLTECQSHEVRRRSLSTEPKPVTPFNIQLAFGIKDDDLQPLEITGSGEHMEHWQKCIRLGGIDNVFVRKRDESNDGSDEVASDSEDEASKTDT